MAVFKRDSSSGNRAQRRAAQRVNPPQAPTSFNIDLMSNQAQSAVYSTPRAMTAAAVQMKLNDKGEVEYFKQRRAGGSADWQAEAWEYYDAIGEIKYAFNLVGSVVSRIRLFAASVDNPSETPVSVRNSKIIDERLAAAAERALARLDSTNGGQAGLLKDAALNLVVSGECYLVQSPARPGSGIAESWDIRSTDELQLDARTTTLLFHAATYQVADALDRVLPRLQRLRLLVAFGDLTHVTLKKQIHHYVVS